MTYNEKYNLSKGLKAYDTTFNTNFFIKKQNQAWGRNSLR